MNSIRGKMSNVKWIDKKKEFVIMITLLEYISYIWRHGQVVRQRSATPLSPVQIWLAPSKNPKCESVRDFTFSLFTFHYSQTLIRDFWEVRSNSEK